MKDEGLKIAVADCETDPFESMRVPRPFVWGFEAVDIPFTNFWADSYDGKSLRKREEIAKECTDNFVDWLYNLPDRYCIYMHNGGKFDFMFLLSYLNDDATIINGRIVKANIGPHQIRDSYAAVPIPLSAYQKDEIDYKLLEILVREENKHEILKYLKGDCKYLLDMMVAWRAEFGNILTMATGAMKALKQHHTYECLTSEQDAFFRQFYYGGRNQCFEVGEIKGNLKVYDINSSYPNVMRNFKHPISSVFMEDDQLTDETDFLVVKGWNRGALCRKDELGYLSFTEKYGTFQTTGHELRAGIETGTFTIDKIESAYTATEHATFEEFIDLYYGRRLECASLAKELDSRGDHGGALLQSLYVIFWKLVLNSSYGKFALNPDSFMDWMITESDLLALDIDVWEPKYQTGDYIFWQKPSEHKNYLNVATGASITGAARAYLLRGLAKATRPVYCDTDSIICEHLEVESDAKKLGAWKLEAEGDAIYIGGKKLYALYKDGKPFVDEKGKHKKASKGVRLEPHQIRTVALGGQIEYANPVPAFKLDGSSSFVIRNIRRTDRNVVSFGA